MAKNDDKLQEILKLVEDGIKNVFESDKYKKYLTTMSKFHSYSFRNNLLILLQKPEATHIAGYTAWQKNFKRQVQRGEKGIQIIGYTPRKINVEQEKKDQYGKVLIKSDGKPETEIVSKQIPSFKTVYVYDISQTDGEPLPQLVNELQGSVEEYQDLLKVIKEISLFPITFENIPSGAKGYCDPLEQKIVIQDGMSEVQSIKTVIHELTHADLHAPEINLALDDRTDRRTREIEAESTAFVVCSHYGIDTSDYTFPYLATWSSSRELTELQSSLEIIQKQAGELINKIDLRLEEIKKDRSIHSELPDKAETEIETEPLDMTISIYQLKDETLTKNIELNGMESLKSKNITPSLDIYNKVYSGQFKLPEEKKLNDIFTEFYLSKPADYKGHNLSISDIIVVEYQNTINANFIDKLGFEPLPAFAEQVKIQRQEQTSLEANRAKEIIDSIQHDGDIDLDREKNRSQLGFNDNAKTDVPKIQTPKTSMKERMAMAKLEASRRNNETNTNNPNKSQTIDNDIRGVK